MDLLVPLLLALVAALLLAALAGYMRLHAAAANATEDTASIGWIAKLAFLARLPLPGLTPHAWLLEGGDGDDHGDDHDHAHDEPRRTLVVSFAGGAVRVGGMTRAEFRRSLRVAAPHADRLFLLDPTGLSFYSFNHATGGFDGQQVLRERLREVTRGYEHVMFIGNCMGANAALTFADCIEAPRAQVVVFNPVVDPRLQGKYRLLTCILPRSVDITARARQGVEGTTATVVVHVADDQSARQHVYRAAEHVQVEEVPVEDGADWLDSLVTRGPARVYMHVHSLQPGEKMTVRGLAKADRLVPLLVAHVAQLEG